MLANMCTWRSAKPQRPFGGHSGPVGRGSDGSVHGSVVSLGAGVVALGVGSEI